MKKLLCLLLSLLFLLAGCDVVLPSSQPSDVSKDTLSQAEPTEAPSEESSGTEPGRLKVACTPGDILNPFTCASRLNLHLSGLLYEGLVQLETDYTCSYILAESIVYEGELSYLVTLRQDAVFSDGSPLTSRDVVVSANAARSSANYAAALVSLSGATAVDDYTVRLTVSSYDPDFVNLLTFPIVQYGTQMSDIPTGSGPYKLSAQGELVVLERNPTFFPESEFVYPYVELVPIEDQHALLYELASGTVDLVFSDLLPGDLNTTGIATYLDENRLCYLGLNSNRLSYRLRTAIACAIDRSDVLISAFAGAGAAAQTPFNPRASQYAGLESSLGYDTAPLEEYLTDAGYTTQDEEGYATRSESRFSLKLLVNSDSSERMLAANTLAEQFKALGLELNIYATPYTKFLTALQADEYDLYLGEVCLPADLDLSSLLNPSSGAIYGFGSDTYLSDAWYLLRTEQSKPQDFLDVFERELPFIPLVYHDTAMAYSRTLPGTLAVSVSNPFAFLYPTDSQGKENTQNS